MNDLGPQEVLKSKILRLWRQQLPCGGVLGERERANNLFLYDPIWYNFTSPNQGQSWSTNHNKHVHISKPKKTFQLKVT